MAILSFSPIAVLAQDQGTSAPVKNDSAKVEKQIISVTKSALESELFPQAKGKEVKEITADSTYSNGLKPKEANKIAKPKKKKGVKISSKDCPVT